tara:strand:+ start:1098 stop:5231 length:4134 start_codon:yes stop_codon:yes gene_type:complete
MSYNKRVLSAIDRDLRDQYRTKRYSKSLSATNSVFAPNPLFSKPSPRRIYNPNAQYFQGGGAFKGINALRRGKILSKAELDVLARAAADYKKYGLRLPSIVSAIKESQGRLLKNQLDPGQYEVPLRGVDLTTDNRIEITADDVSRGTRDRRFNILGKSEEEKLALMQDMILQSSDVFKTNIEKYLENPYVIETKRGDSLVFDDDGFLTEPLGSFYHGVGSTSPGFTLEDLEFDRSKIDPKGFKDWTSTGTKPGNSLTEYGFFGGLNKNQGAQASLKYDLPTEFAISKLLRDPSSRPADLGRIKEIGVSPNARLVGGNNPYVLNALRDVGVHFIERSTGPHIGGHMGMTPQKAATLRSKYGIDGIIDIGGNELVILNPDVITSVSDVPFKLFDYTNPLQVGLHQNKTTQENISNLLQHGFGAQFIDPNKLQPYLPDNNWLTGGMDKLGSVFNPDNERGARKVLNFDGVNRTLGAREHFTDLPFSIPFGEKWWKAAEPNLDLIRQRGGPIEVKQRKGVRKNPDGSESTHLMRAEQLEDGSWVAFPSLFQDDDGAWVDMSQEENWYKILDEAERRGEVYNFGKDKEAALAFGEGSWKDQLSDEGVELELDDEEIQKYVDGGYIVEDLPKAQLGAALAKAAKKLPVKNFKSQIDWGKWNKNIPNNKPLIEEYRAIEYNTKQNDTWMKNADGSLFKGTPEQFVQQQSKNFKKAFPQGAGYTYRGSTFKNLEDLHQPLFTSTDREIAERYTKHMWTGRTGDLHELYYPISSNSADFDTNKSDWNSLKLDGDPTPNQPISVPKELNEVAKGLISQFPKTVKLDGFFRRREVDEGAGIIKTDDIMDYMIKNDVDNVKLNNILDSGWQPQEIYGNVTMINNRPGNRVKSAIGNDGMFDMSNSNIYKSLLPLTLGLPFAFEDERNKRKKLKDGGLPKAQKGTSLSKAINKISKNAKLVQEVQPSIQKLTSRIISNKINNTKKGLKRAIKDITQEGRSFGEVLPLTPSQKKAADLEASLAVQEGVDFNDKWLYEVDPKFGKILRKDISDKILDIYEFSGPQNRQDKYFAQEFRGEVDGDGNQFKGLGRLGLGDGLTLDNTLVYSNNKYGLNLQNPLVKTRNILRPEGITNILSSKFTDPEKRFLLKNYLENDSAGVNQSSLNLSVTNPGIGLYRYPSSEITDIALHEAAHTAQRLGMESRGFGDVLAKFDSSKGYFYPNEDTNIGRFFKEIMPDKDWVGSPNELHSELMVVRKRIYDEWVNNPSVKEAFKVDPNTGRTLSIPERDKKISEWALGELRNPSNSTLDSMLEMPGTSTPLNSFFKKGVPREKKYQALRYLPGLAIPFALPGLMDDNDKPKLQRGGALELGDEVTEDMVEELRKQGYTIEEI